MSRPKDIDKAFLLFAEAEAYPLYQRLAAVCYLHDVGLILQNIYLSCSDPLRQSVINAVTDIEQGLINLDVRPTIGGIQIRSLRMIAKKMIKETERKK